MTKSTMPQFQANMFHFYCRPYQELSYLSNFRELNLPKQTNGFDILGLTNLDPNKLMILTFWL